MEKKQVIFFFSKELLNDTAIAAKSVGIGGANERAKIICDANDLEVLAYSGN